MFLIRRDFALPLASSNSLFSESYLLTENYFTGTTNRNGNFKKDLEVLILHGFVFASGRAS